MPLLKPIYSKEIVVFFFGVRALGASVYLSNFSKCTEFPFMWQNHLNSTTRMLVYKSEIWQYISLSNFYYCICSFVLARVSLKATAYVSLLEMKERKLYVFLFYALRCLVSFRKTSECPTKNLQLRMEGCFVDRTRLRMMTASHVCFSAYAALLTNAVTNHARFFKSVSFTLNDSCKYIMSYASFPPNEHCLIVCLPSLFRCQTYCVHSKCQLENIILFYLALSIIQVPNTCLLSILIKSAKYTHSCQDNLFALNTLASQ